MEDEYPCPDYYPLFVAADRCHAKPWEMLEVPVYWRDKALIVATAEAEAQESISNFRGS
jgi:hypothetical protein